MSRLCIFRNDSCATWPDSFFSKYCAGPPDASKAFLWKEAVTTSTLSLNFASLGSTGLISQGTGAVRDEPGSEDDMDPSAKTPQKEDGYHVNHISVRSSMPKSGPHDPTKKNVRSDPSCVVGLRSDHPPKNWTPRSDQSPTSQNRSD